MKTRASAKREAQGVFDGVQSGTVQPQISDGRSQKRTRRKGPSQPVRGGWDELPHNLGRVELFLKDTLTPTEKESLRSNIPGPLPPTPGPTTGNGIDGGRANEEVGSATPVQRPRLKTEVDSSLPSPPLDVKDEKNVKAATATRIRRKTKENPYGLMFGRTPYPDWQSPSIEACEEVHRLLTEVHGEVIAPAAIPPPSLTVAGCGEVPSVLDAVIRTILSGATTMVAANEAFAAMVDKYGTVRSGTGKGSVNWKKVRQSSVEELAETIKRGGLGNIKAAHIKEILDMVWAEQKRLSLDHLHGKTAQEAMQELVRYPSVGIKTAACVILFCLRVPCFAVDTHVHRFSKWLKWVPPTASAEMTFWHCEYLVPDYLKYGLHQLFIRHGQTCSRCKADTAEGTETWEGTTCALEHLLERNKLRRSKIKAVKKVKKEGVEGGQQNEEASIEPQAGIAGIDAIEMEKKGASVDDSVGP